MPPSESTDTLPTSPYFTLERLAEGVWAAIVARGTGAWSNAGIISLGDRTLVFDTFLTPTEYAEWQARTIFADNLRHLHTLFARSTEDTEEAR